MEIKITQGQHNPYKIMRFDIIISVIYILIEEKSYQTLGRRFSTLDVTFSQFLGNCLSSGCCEEDCGVSQTTQRTKEE